MSLHPEVQGGVIVAAMVVILATLLTGSIYAYNRIIGSTPMMLCASMCGLHVTKLENGNCYCGER